MPFTNLFDNTFPPDTQLANLLGDDIRKLKVDVQQRMAAISGLDAAKPNFAADSQPAAWNGILFFATDTGKIYQFNNPSWTNVTSAFTGSGVKKYYDGTDVTQSSGASGTLNTVTISGGALVGSDTSGLGNTIMIDALVDVTTGSGSAGVQLRAGSGPVLLANVGLPINSHNLVCIHSMGVCLGSNQQRFTTSLIIMHISGTTSGFDTQAYMNFVSQDLSTSFNFQTYAVGATGSSIQGRLLTVEAF